jgi:hypothetical protein
MPLNTREDPEGESGALRRLAQQCRALARGASTRDVAASLAEMAEEYEERAGRFDRAGALSR